MKAPRRNNRLPRRVAGHIQVAFALFSDLPGRGERIEIRPLLGQRRPKSNTLGALALVVFRPRCLGSR
jgi:hypothetical protein